MGHLPFILAALVVVGRDAIERPMGVSRLDAGTITAVTLASLLGVWLVFSIRLAWLCKQIDRRGSLRAVRRAIGLTRNVQLALTIMFAIDVLLLGWLDAVRATVGDGVGWDEAIALLPYLVASLACVWSGWGLDRRLHEAALIREIEEGRTIYAVPSRWRATLAFARHQPLFVMLPVLAILAWSELVARFAEGATAFTIQGAGALAVLAISPLMVRWMWDTTPVGDGPLRARLEEIARRHHVRVRGFLIWHTRGAQINAAVIGVAPWLRYVVITDALLESLPSPEVEAVAAHEIGHIRRRHIPWLIGAAIGPALLFGLGAEAIAIAVYLPPTLPGIIVGAIAALTIFGVVSRRFERQADAFAAAHLSAHDPASENVTQGAAEVMASALLRVARLNGLPVRRRTWRHGSIVRRCRALADGVGSTIGATPQDRAANIAKLGVLAMVVAGVAWAVLSGAD